MGVAPAAYYALSVVSVSLVVGFVWMFYRLTDESRVERASNHKFLLDLIERVQAESLQEIVSAEAMRGDLEKQKIEEITRQSELAEEITHQNEMGFFGELAEGRAFLVKHGIDPNDAEAVRRWNARFGETVM